MAALDLFLRRPRSSVRRLVALALFALQGGIVASPFMEPRSEGRLSAHAEQDGARHVNLHNEATCALCSVRAQTSMPAQGATEIACPRHETGTAMESYAAPSCEDAPNNLSRAPPLVS